MCESRALSNDIKRLSEDIDEQITRIRQRIANAPDGCLRISKRGKKYQYFHIINANDTHGTYIPRKDQSLAAALAQKDYDIKVLAALESQRKAIEDFLNKYDQNAEQHVYDKLNAPRKELIDKGFLTDEEYIARWLNEPYKKMSFSSDSPAYYTAKGIRVRSKSELIIANTLDRYNIPYRYEYPLYRGDTLMAVPDFNCLNIRQRQDYYWEHLGMMSNRDYANKNVCKLEKFSLNGAFDDSRLILTFETDSHPLNTKVIEAKIRRYLL